MAQTPSRFGGDLDGETPLEAGELLLEDIAAGDPSLEGATRYVSGEFRMVDGIGAFNPRNQDVTLDDVLANQITPADCIGQVLYSIDGLTFSVSLPVSTKNGWLVNNCGLLLIQG